MSLALARLLLTPHLFYSVLRAPSTHVLPFKSSRGLALQILILEYFRIHTQVDISCLRILDRKLISEEFKMVCIILFRSQGVLSLRKFQDHRNL